MPSAATLLPAETERWFGPNNLCDALHPNVNTGSVQFLFNLLFSSAFSSHPKRNTDQKSMKTLPVRCGPT